MEYHQQLPHANLELIFKLHIPDVSNIHQNSGSTKVLIEGSTLHNLDDYKFKEAMLLLKLHN